MSYQNQAPYGVFKLSQLTAAVLLAGLSLGASSLSFAAETDNSASPSTAATDGTTPAADATPTFDSVVVTARNREELAQSVPVPISVLGGKQLDRDNTVSVQDLTTKAPGLTATTPNARRRFPQSAARHFAPRRPC